jgi:hypothetical protein
MTRKGMNPDELVDAAKKLSPAWAGERMNAPE